jgi:antiviral defense system Shedu protein SduA
MNSYQPHDDTPWPDDPWAETEQALWDDTESDPWAGTGDDGWAGVDDDPRGGAAEVHDEITYTLGRTPSCTYFSKSFDQYGEPARFVVRVFDSEDQLEVEPGGHMWVLRTSPNGRSQVKFLIRGKERNVTDIWFTRILTTKSGDKTKECIHFDGQNAERLIEMIRSLEYVPIEGGQRARVDDALMREILASPAALTSLYRNNPDAFRQLITDDTSASDVIAVAYRRNQVEHFRQLLENSDYFDDQVKLTGTGRPEDVWQRFFEANPWILGISLTGQILTSWSSEKLEQVVAGRSVAGVGKRTDALLRTAGRIRSLVFAEFKTHRTPLLDPRKEPYRSGCYGPSADLAGGVAQLQGTVHRALTEIGERLASLAPDGSEIPDDYSYLIRPRAFLLIGSLEQLRGDQGGVHTDRFRSFELYRHNTTEPEILTYDELLARAEWHVSNPQA